ncbi:acyltransferase [Opitutaceae bacterium EW11]|nr:acyltransferase [Opitutaceae bacterium EW11]
MEDSAPAPASSHENNFNFLRLLFASLVLFAHGPELVDGNRSRELLTLLFGNSRYTLGMIAVAGFFFISGYLILQSWNRNPRLVPYLGKRLRRIVPGFWAASLVCALIVGPLGAPAADYFAQFSLKRFVMGALFLTEPSIPPVFAGQPQPFVNGSMWTIQYEFFCYLAVILLGTLGLARRPRLYLGLAVLLLAAVIAVDLHPIVVPQFRFYYLLPANVERLTTLWMLFCVGGCFLLFRNEIRFTRARTVIAAAILVLGLCVPSLTRYCLITGGAYLLFAVAFARIPLFAWFNSKPDISYGVYLYGWPVQKLIHWYLPRLSPAWLVGLALPICAGCGWLSWHAVEKRFLGSRRRVAARVAPAVVSVPSLASVETPETGNSPMQLATDVAREAAD